ncbi:MAG: hypothetical protein HY597_06130 [Candidatus Omnitrophica bacterium]|nr:hypothetical protein [Candidatus Omnitrophota bacterium]
MRRRPLLQLLMTVVVSVSTAVCLSAAALPHEHRRATPGHHPVNCHACHLQQGFSASPPAASAVQAPPVLVAMAALRPCEAPRAVVCLRLASPRAPPILS